MVPVRSVVAELDTVHKRFLTIKAQDKASQDFLKKLKEDDDRRPRISTQSSDSLIRVKDEVNEDDQEGPNRRGTYSRQYTLLHPEVEWVHRGQGRYLPASHHSHKSGSSQPDR